MKNSKIPLFLAVFCVPLFSFANDGKAIHSPFTIEQITEHLGLEGGNWSVEFEKPCFLGFMMTKTDDGGSVTRNFYWSSKASRAHEFHFMHQIIPGAGTDNDHELKFSSEQKDEWNEEGAVRWKVSGGSGLTYRVSLPSAGEQQIMDGGDIKLQINEPALLFSWGGTETQRVFRLDVVAATTKEEAEELLKPE